MPNQALAVEVVHAIRKHVGLVSEQHVEGNYACALLLGVRCVQQLQNAAKRLDPGASWNEVIAGAVQQEFLQQQLSADIMNQHLALGFRVVSQLRSVVSLVQLLQVDAESFLSS